MAGGSQTRTAGTGTNTGIGGVNWVNPGNVSSSSSFSTCALTVANDLSEGLTGTNFGFTLPSNAFSIDIVVSLQRKCSITTDITGNQLFLVYSGSQIGQAASYTPNWTTTAATDTISNSSGGSASWLANLTVAEANDSSFGFTMGCALQSGAAATGDANNYQITLNYHVPPTVSSVSTNTGTTAGGTAVTVSGTNFDSGLACTFNGVSATSIVVNSPTSISCSTPANSAGAVNVVVTNTDGGTGTGTGVFTYENPTVASVSASSGTQNGGTNVTITGTYFAASGLGVTFGGTSATNISFVKSSTITCTTPSGTPGAVNVVVTVTDGSGTGVGAYVYISEPTLSSCSPNNGFTTGGTSVTITGTNFLTGATITFNGVSATGITYASSTSYTATTPAGTAGAATIVLTNSDGGTASSSVLYTYVVPPQPPSTGIFGPVRWFSK